LIVSEKSVEKTMFCYSAFFETILGNKLEKLLKDAIVKQNVVILRS